MLSNVVGVDEVSIKRGDATPHSRPYPALSSIASGQTRRDYTVVQSEPCESLRLHLADPGAGQNATL